MSIRIFVSGVGGQGSVTASAIIGEAAVAMGLSALASEIHGMSQRGGVVESTVVVGEARSPLVPDRGADILIGMEPVEAARSLRKCGPQTVVLFNSHPIVPFTVSLGKETYPDIPSLVNELKAVARQVFAFDAFELATQAGNVRTLSTVLLGALAGLELLSIPRDQWLETILRRVPTKAAAANGKAFDLGYHVTAGRLL